MLLTLEYGWRFVMWLPSFIHKHFDFLRRITFVCNWEESIYCSLRYPAQHIYLLVFNTVSLQLTIHMVYVCTNEFGYLVGMYIYMTSNDLCIHRIYAYVHFTLIRFSKFPSNGCLNCTAIVKTLDINYLNRPH